MSAPTSRGPRRPARSRYKFCRLLVAAGEVYGCRTDQLELPLPVPPVRRRQRGDC